MNGRDPQIIGKIANAISNLSRDQIDIDSLPESKKTIALLVQLESDMEYLKLNALATRSEKLDPFYEFLTRRGLKIRKTDANFLFSNSLINRACLEMARQLPKEGNQLLYDLLLLVSSNQYYFSGRGNLSCLKLHEFILRDDGSPLEVQQGLEYLEQTMHRVKTSDAAFKPLTMEEEQLIKHHSPEAEAYADAITLKQDVREAKEKFLSAVRGDRYCVTASYGEEGKDELVKGILQDIPSVDELTHVMATLLPERHWNLFLTTLKRDDLFRVVLGVDLSALQTQFKQADAFNKAWLAKTDEALGALTQKPKPFKDEMQLRAFIVSVLTAYKLSRQEGPEFKSNTGYYVGYYFSWAFSKEVMTSAVDVFIDFVLSNKPLTNESLQQHLKEKNLYDTYWTPITYSSMLKTNVLSSLVKMSFDSYKTLEPELKLTQQKGL